MKIRPISEIGFTFWQNKPSFWLPKNKFYIYIYIYTCYLQNTPCSSLAGCTLPDLNPWFDIHRLLELVTLSSLERLEAFSQHRDFGSQVVEQGQWGCDLTQVLDTQLRYPEIFEIAQRRGISTWFWETLFWPAKCGPAPGCLNNYSPQLDAEMQIGAMDVAGDGWDLFGGLIWPLLNGKRSGETGGLDHPVAW